MNKFSKVPVAIVTGGVGLLGTQHVIALCQLGKKVIVFDNNTNGFEDFTRLVESEGISPEYFEVKNVDLQSEVEISRAVAEVVHSNGRLDVVLNNAAYNPPPRVGGPSNLVEDFDIDVWNQELNIGLTSAILLIKYSLPHMREGGVILNIASDLSVISPDQRIYSDFNLDTTKKPYVKSINYSIIKTGVVGMTRYLATYLAPRGIRVNCLSPGGVYARQDIGFVTKLEKLIPLGRMAHETEYRGVVKFLCSSESSYMTGQNVVVDGGRSVW
jgi:NAD(P)-dependent dehydrogenase (short-subunit alcohol dehydrogenase family)